MEARCSSWVPDITRLQAERQIAQEAGLSHSGVRRILERQGHSNVP